MGAMNQASTSYNTFFLFASTSFLFAHPIQGRLMNQIHTNSYLYSKKVGLMNQTPTEYEPNPKKQLYIRQQGRFDESNPYRM
jgi:hypothetical protein